MNQLKTKLPNSAISGTSYGQRIESTTATVVVVHGLASNRLDMWPIAQRLRWFGYDVINWGYPSTRKTIEHHGRSLANRLKLASINGRQRLHVVAHSMGCIVARCALAADVPENFGRLVMLAPPNQGSFAARKLSPWLGWYSKTLVELSDDRDSFVNQLPPLQDVDFGVVAAQKDRVIETSRTLLPGMNDFTIVNTGHGAMPWIRRVGELSHKYLESGRF